MAPNDTYLLSVKGTQFGTQHIHTLHFRAGSQATGPAQLATEWQSSAGAAYRAIFSNVMPAVELIKVQHICGAEPLEAPVEVIPAVGSVNGTRATTGDGMPSFIAACVTERTALAGKSRRGRFFIGGIWETDTATNQLLPAYIALIQNYVNALMTAFVTPPTPNWRLVVHSRKLADVVGTQCQNSSTPVVSMTINPNTTTMRSRKLGHGQ